MKHKRKKKKKKKRIRNGKVKKEKIILSCLIYSSLNFERIAAFSELESCKGSLEYLDSSDAEALGKLGDERAIEPLQQLLEYERHLDVCSEARTALEEINKRIGKEEGEE